MKRISHVSFRRFALFVGAELRDERVRVSLVWEDIWGEWL